MNRALIPVMLTKFAKRKLIPRLPSLRGKAESDSLVRQRVGGEARFVLCLYMSLLLLLSGSAGAQGTNRVHVSTAWRVAEAEGRTLWVNEQSVTLQTDARTQVQVGWQRFIAKGRVRSNRFSTTARWYSLELVLREELDRRMVFSLRRLEGSEGRADVAEGLFTYTHPRVDTTSLLALQRAGKWFTGYRLAYSRTRAGTEAADTLGLSLLAFPMQNARLQVHWEGGIYADRRGDTSYRPVLSTAVTFPVGHGLRAQFGATFAPSGFPMAGTSIEGLTAFVVYRPGSLVEGWRDRPAGYLSLQLGIER